MSHEHKGRRAYFFENAKRITFPRVYFYLREIHGCSYPGLENSKVSQSQFKDFSEPSSNHPPPPLDEIGKTFANRSGSVMRKFSTLLRRGKRTSKTLSASFLESSSDA